MKKSDCFSLSWPLICFGLSLLSFVLSFFVDGVWVLIFCGLTLVLSGFQVVMEGIQDSIQQSKEAKRLRLNNDLLMALASIGAFIIGAYHEGALLMVIFAGAHFLETMALDKSKRAIEALLSQNPVQARLVVDKDHVLVDVETLKLGDRVAVLVGDKIPIDGSVVSGQGLVDQAVINGESMPVTKSVGDEVFAGTMNIQGSFILSVTKESKDTVFAKMLTLVQESQTKKSAFQGFLDAFQPIYATVVILVLPVIFCFQTFVLKWNVPYSFYRTLNYLIAASPCALAASTISSTLSSLALLSRHAILCRGSQYLTSLKTATAICFDKTGTLTLGQPHVVAVSVDPKAKDIEDIISKLVSVERLTNHPIATALIEHYSDAGLQEVDQVDNILGQGIVGTFGPDVLKVGKVSDPQAISWLKESSGTLVQVVLNDQIKMVIQLEDKFKDRAKETVAYFKGQGLKTVMISGDNKKAAQAVASHLDLDEVYADVLPQDKVEVVKNLQAKGHGVIMVGDGINDSPSLLTSQVGVALGQVDAAIEAGDVVLLKDDLDRLVFAHQVAKKHDRIVKQNVVIALGVVCGLVLLNALELSNMALSTVLHEGSTIVVILNGLRMLRLGKRDSVR